jgi:hypothetical protein
VVCSEVITMLVDLLLDLRNVETIPMHVEVIEETCFPS